MRGVVTLLGIAGALLTGPAEPAPIRFREVAQEMGIDFVHDHGGTGDFFMIETMGSGVTAFDYDGDGDDDLLFVQSGSLPRPGVPPGPVSRLYRNDGSAGFVDVTEAAAVGVPIYGMGATAGDIDGDGDLDLYLTAYGSNRLLANGGDGRFLDVTESSGVGDESWSASAAFSDVDRDGDLDLYVTNYVDFTFDNNPPCGLPERKLRSYCHPDVYAGLPDRFYRNRGDGTFEDATDEAGFGAADGKGLGVIFGDIDRDGAVDLYVANDMTANFLFRNLGDGTFEEIALVAGAAFDDRGEAEAGMGVALGDLDDNGFPDILVTHLDKQANALYSNSGLGLFIDRRYPSKLAEPSFHKVGFGIALGDFDQDAFIDVAIANGHIIHNVDEWGTTTSFRQPNQVLRNLGDGTFDEVEDSGLDQVLSSRGLALLDLEGDGDLDLAISNSTERAEIYENRTDSGTWLKVSLARNGESARVRVTAGSRVQEREARTASSYLSQSAADLHFGLGRAPSVDAVLVDDPRGGVRRYLDLPANRRVTVWPGE